MQGAGRVQFANGEFSGSAFLRARAYQEQITETIYGFVYRLNGVAFDGFRSGRLLDAKGPGYANFFQQNLRPKPWWVTSGQRMVADAQRQVQAANGTPIEWHVAEQRAADGIRLLFQNAGIRGITVIHTPPQ